MLGWIISLSTLAAFVCIGLIVSNLAAQGTLVIVAFSLLLFSILVAVWRVGNILEARPK